MPWLEVLQNLPEKSIPLAPDLPKLGERYKINTRGTNSFTNIGLLN
jgi:hypothetical protein